MFSRSSKLFYTRCDGVTKLLILTIIICILCIRYNSTTIVAMLRSHSGIHGSGYSDLSGIKMFIENNKTMAGIKLNDETIRVDRSNTDEMENMNTAHTGYDYANDGCYPREPELSTVPLPRTALASFMGSGNTWTRHLIQQMTGIATSSVYCDRALSNHGFPYECYRNRSNVAVVKTHRSHAKQFDRAVLILRNPFDAFISALNWEYAGHVNHAGNEKLRQGMSKKINGFIRSYTGLVKVFVKDFKGPVYVLQYELMKSNLTNQLAQLANFLNLKVSTRDIECTVRLQAGNFHRKTDKDVRKQLLLDIYDIEKQQNIYVALHDVETMLQDRFHKQFKIIKTLEELFTTYNNNHGIDNNIV